MTRRLDTTRAGKKKDDDDDDADADARSSARARVSDISVRSRIRSVDGFA
jgi:hypothetical protein